MVDIGCDAGYNCRTMKQLPAATGQQLRDKRRQKYGPPRLKPKRAFRFPCSLAYGGSFPEKVIDLVGNLSSVCRLQFLHDVSDVNLHGAFAQV